MFNILSKAVSSLASDIFFFILASLLTIYIYIYIERERERERENGDKGEEMEERVRYKKIKSAVSRGSGWRIHCGLEVSELSTNKQHTLCENTLVRGGVGTQVPISNTLSVRTH